MRVLVTGASGFIGGRLVSALLARGHQIRAVARRPQAQRPREGVEWVAGDFATDTTAAIWAERLKGVDAVVNAAGIIRETKVAKFDQVHAAGPCALFEACAASNICKVVQISAIGVDENARSRFRRTKRQADDFLSELALDWVILRPSFVYGAGDQSMTFFKLLAWLPVVPLVGDGRSESQPVHVDDLVRACVLALETGAGKHQRIDVGGSERLSFDALLARLEIWWGRRSAPARRWHAPMGLMRLVARVTDALGRGPITRDELMMFERGAASEQGAFEPAFGFVPRSFDQGLAEEPCTQKDRWYAALSVLEPPLRAALAFVWLATGIVSAFIYPADESLALLATSGVDGTLAVIALYATSAFEMIIGALLLFGVGVRWVGAIQVALVLGFTVILTVTQPQFWVHPFGPLTKNIPFIMATLVVMALAPGGRR